MRRPHAARDSGFTLVELMVVLAILGILVTVAVASYFVATNRSKRIACVQNQRALQSALTVYESLNIGERPDDLNGLKTYVNWPSVNYGKCTDTGAPLQYDKAAGEISCATPNHVP